MNNLRKTVRHVKNILIIKNGKNFIKEGTVKNKVKLQIMLRQIIKNFLYFLQLLFLFHRPSCFLQLLKTKKIFYLKIRFLFRNK